jgi:hypothetical protein
MKLQHSLLALAALASVNIAKADVILLNFEGTGNLAQVLDFYNGGTDNQGNSGSNYHVSFNPYALSLIDEEAGGSGNFANEPSASTALFFVDNRAVMNYAPGFSTGFSFFYSAAASAIVDIFDGLDGTGNLLASISLNSQYGDGCSGDPAGEFCNWTSIGTTFAGLAKSVYFGNAANAVAFDNLTLGAVEPLETPEPETLALLGLGLGLGCLLRKRSA